ncbi:pyridoxal phosphate-dependent decarboxylase family protein [Amycolatopsis sp. H20-H5]|uniref:pyridoxal phosphate-dependent decarboxylase family protein n=1 Tax=Amycolatopsis sp. H20-H5 TaxID=3046309 RepID=UPI002DB8A4D9|nr:aminotransferase class V-fold PLP-dependent enzyme [Amycolatopsis sp. H20-H5]MEC3978125.1 aminotransferase class V-fold PLP-dependent enzyme [Amycolatopsis sp. H20-H5]
MTAVFPLEPSRDQVATLMAAATEFATDFLGSLNDAPPRGGGPAAPAAPPGEHPGDLDRLLRTFGAAAAAATDTAGPRCFAYFPGGGLFSSAVAEMLARTVNRYTGAGSMAAELVALEHSVVRWLCDEFGLPTTASGVLTTGASTGTLSALVAARHELLGERAGTLYVTEHTHHCVAKAARIAGFAADRVRVVPSDSAHRMDVRAAEEMIAEDRAAGRRPFLLVGTAGTTSTGAIDPLPELAAVAAREGLWFHVDAAYGGGFQLTGRGRAKLAGVELADSLTLDTHKSLFQPQTTGVLLVRDPRALRAAHVADADYLQDLHLDESLPNYADLGAELSRDYRGLRLWLPLHLHGVGAFRDALDEKLDLSAVIRRELAEMRGLEICASDLTVHVFRVAGGDAVNRRLLERINESGRVALTSTKVDGRTALRMCVLNHRTHAEHVDEALKLIADSI